jgi:hypothetical protein
VTPNQSNTIKSALQKHPMQITISWAAGDPEGSAFSRQLAESFLSGGAEISAFAPSVAMGQEPHGLSVSGSEREEIELLAGALTASGFGRVTTSLDARKSDGTKYFTHLQVGYREPPSLTMNNSP